MQPTRIQTSNTLLTYSLVTSPTPVQVSPSTTTPSVAALTLVVSCPRSVGTATVSQISITLPVDQSGKPPDPINLAATAPPLSSASISSSGTDVWVPAAGVGPGVFIFTPKTGPVKVSTQSLTIEFTGIQVNTLVGTALVTLNEWAASGSNAPPPVTGPPSGTIQFAVAKFPYGFYAGNFTADKPMVQNGQKPVLSWTGSVNATYLMLYEANPPLDVSTLRTWSPPQPLTQTTTFILQVSAQQGGQTASIDFSITIEVSNPSLSAKDLTVLTNANLNGPVTVGTSSAPADLSLKGNLNAGQNASVSGTLNAAVFNASGAAKLMSTLNVTGAATFAGALTASGALAAGGTVAFLGQPVQVSGSGTAATDGFLIGSISQPSDGSYRFNGTIYGSSGGITVQATGGGWVSGINPPNYYGDPVSGSFILPVRKGASWQVGVIQPWVSIPLPPIAFYWIPLGVGSAGGGAKAAAREDFAASPSAPAVAPRGLPFQFSGQARLAKGRAIVKFGDAIPAPANAADGPSYCVLMTPTERCGGLAVTKKTRNGFVVEELAGGESNAGFDWFIIAQQTAVARSKMVKKMPRKLSRGKSARQPRTPKKK